MREEWICFIWQYRYFRTDALYTVDGKKVEVLRPGIRNGDSGPDFFNAKIAMNRQVWVGNIEMHVRGQEWYEHHHESDAAYNNVILHVVWDDAKPCISLAGREIPVVCLRPLVSEALVERCMGLEQSREKLACGMLLKEVEPVKIRAMLARALMDRLEQKYEEFLLTLDYYAGSWEMASYEWMASCLGMRVNAQPMRMLARTVRLNMASREKRNRDTLEMLFLYASGLIPERVVPHADWKEKGEVLARKYHFRPMNPHVWKYGKMRPSNFPHFRIRQFAGLVHKTDGWLSTLMETDSYPGFVKWLSDEEGPKLGESARQGIFINGVALVWFSYGKFHQQPAWIEKAIDLLEGIEPENNRITRLYERAGFRPANAADAQGCIALYKYWCLGKKCLNCGIGTTLLRPANPG